MGQQRTDRHPGDPVVGRGEGKLPGIPVDDVQQPGHELEGGPGDEHGDRRALQAVRQRPQRRPGEQLRVHRPQLRGKQRDRGQAGCHVQTLGEAVYPYRPVSSGIQEGGCCSRWLMSPVTNATKKQLPSATPMSDAVRSSCRLLRNAPGRSGPCPQCLRPRGPGRRHAAARPWRRRGACAAGRCSRRACGPGRGSPSGRLSMLRWNLIAEHRRPAEIPYGLVTVRRRCARGQ